MFEDLFVGSEEEAFSKNTCLYIRVALYFVYFVRREPRLRKRSTSGKIYLERENKFYDFLALLDVKRFPRDTEEQRKCGEQKRRKKVD